MVYFEAHSLHFELLLYHNKKPLQSHGACTLYKEFGYLQIADRTKKMFDNLQDKLDGLANTKVK
jgi:hypothetical protein